LSIFATKIGHPEKGEKKGTKREGGGGVVGEKSESKTKRNFSLSQPSFLPSFLCCLLVVVAVVFVNGGAFRQRRCVHAFAAAASVAAQRATERPSEREKGAGELLLG